LSISGLLSAKAFMRPFVIAVSVSVKSRSAGRLPLPMMNIGAFFWSVIATNAPHSGASILALMPTLRELRLDRFAELAVHQVAPGRDVERGLEAVRMAGLGEQLAALAGIVRPRCECPWRRRSPATRSRRRACRRR
jgi:hypothetical protein